MVLLESSKKNKNKNKYTLVGKTQKFVNSFKFVILVVLFCMDSSMGLSEQPLIQQ